MCLICFRSMKILCLYHRLYKLCSSGHMTKYLPHTCTRPRTQDPACTASDPSLSPYMYKSIEASLVPSRPQSTSQSMLYCKECYNTCVNDLLGKNLVSTLAKLHSQQGDLLANHGVVKVWPKVDSLLFLTNHTMLLAT